MKKLICAAVAGLAVSSFAALAQTTPQGPAQSMPQPGVQRGDAAAGQQKISEYFERDVYLSDGTEVGEIADLLVDSGNRITGAVVEVEGSMGLGERRVVLPLERLKIESDRLVLDMTVEQLRQLPNYAADDNGK